MPGASTQALRDATVRRLLELLRERGPSTVRELAPAFGGRPTDTTLRAYLEQLAAAGQVAREEEWRNDWQIIGGYHRGRSYRVVRYRAREP